MNYRREFLTLAIVALSWVAVIAAPPITAATLAPEGTHVIVGSQAGVEIRSWPELKAIASIKTELDHVHDLRFSPNGDRLLIAGGSPAESGAVEICAWPTRARLQQFQLHDDLIYRVAWSADGKEFATASADGVCKVVDAKTGKRTTEYQGHSRAVLSVAYLPDGTSILSAGADQTLQLWNRKTGERIRTLDNHLAAVNDIAVKPQATRDTPPVVVSVSHDRTVRLWQPTIGRLVRFARLDSPAHCAAWSDDGQIVVGCNDGQVRRIDPDTLAIQHDSQKYGGIHVLVSAPQDRWLVGGENGLREAFK